MNRIPEDQRRSERIRFSYEPRTDGWLVTAPCYSDLFSETLCKAVPPHLRYQPRRRSQVWLIDPSAAQVLAASLEAAGYAVAGLKRDHMHIPELGCALCAERAHLREVAPWARTVFELAGKRHRDRVFASLLRVLDIDAMRILARAYDEVA